MRRAATSTCSWSWCDRGPPGRSFMKRLSVRAIGCALLFAGVLWFAPRVSAAGAETGADIVTLVQKGREALIAEKFAEASKLLEQAIAQPGFASTDPELQFFAFVLASYAAGGTEDNLSAYEYVVAATRYPSADGELWVRRAALAA